MNYVNEGKRNAGDLPALITTDVAHSVHVGHTDFGHAVELSSVWFTLKRPAFRNSCSTALAAEAGQDGSNTGD